LRVIFCANPSFALPSLRALLASRHRVAAVVTSPDKPQGRGRKLAALPVKIAALEHGLPVWQPENLRQGDFLNQIRGLAPDALVVVAFRILPRELFALPRYGAFNVHPSLLPRGRGPAPLRWTLLRGETETGVSIIQLSEQVDGGGILRQEKTAVLPDENYGSLHDRLSQLGAELLISVLDAFDDGQPPAPLDQDENLVTRAPKLRAVDFIINFQRSAQEICCQIRALSPEPGAVAVSTESRLKILAAQEVRVPAQLVPGQWQLVNRDGLLVGTGHGVIRLDSVQPEGKRPMSAAEFLRGRPKLPERFGH
jgi:methionyl-tRNA formyltransferase